MKRYEYHFVHFEGADALPERAELKLNELGAQGWKVFWHGSDPRTRHSGWWMMRELDSDVKDTDSKQS